ncbi:MAG: hypothetical protein CL933_02135 [Deltaproteobacteria bacterium]|nr:hypothetical protein [Deltaproteobacteria bacterium]
MPIALSRFRAFTCAERMACAHVRKIEKVARTMALFRMEMTRSGRLMQATSVLGGRFVYRPGEAHAGRARGFVQ